MILMTQRIKFSYYIKYLKLKCKANSNFFTKDKIYEAKALSSFNYTKQGKVFTTYTDYMVRDDFGSVHILLNKMMDKIFKIEVD